jgi:DNA invertase Pin-like site-specific DNA recombinase
MDIVTDIEEYIDDGYSGEFIERPALDRLRADMRAKKIKRIVIYDPDRMSRNLSVQLIIADEIEKHKVELYFVTGDYDCSPEGKLFFNMKGAVSAYEKEKIRQRTMDGKRNKAKSGKLTFNDSPLGYDYDKDKSYYIINQQEAEIIKLIYQTYINEIIGVMALATKLNAMGFKTKKDNPFNGAGVLRILKNEMYAGTKQAFKNYDKKVSQYKKKREQRDQSEWIAIEVPAIVTREQWETVQEKMKQNKILASRKAKHDYLLRGKIVCGECGYAMIGTTSSKPKHTYHYYTCSSRTVYKRPCPACNYRADDIDNKVWSKLLYCAQNDIDPTSITVKNNNDIDINKISNYISELKKRQAIITKWVATGTMTDLETADQQIQAIKKEIDVSQSLLKQNKPAKISFDRESILNAVTFEQKRKLILKMNAKFSLTNTDVDIIPC